MQAAKTAAEANAIAQVGLFHLNTFSPSITPNGIRLNTAKNALMKATNQKRSCVTSATRMHPNESIMFVIGPDSAIFPTVLPVPEPTIITAPGEIILKGGGRNTETKVMSAPCMVSLNSAHSLKCCAENLWAIS